MNKVQIERTMVTIVEEDGSENVFEIREIPDPILQQELIGILIASKFKIKKLKKVKKTIPPKN